MCINKSFVNDLCNSILTCLSILTRKLVRRRLRPQPTRDAAFVRSRGRQHSDAARSSEASLCLPRDLLASSVTLPACNFPLAACRSPTPTCQCPRPRYVRYVREEEGGEKNKGRGKERGGEWGGRGRGSMNVSPAECVLLPQVVLWPTRGPGVAVRRFTTAIIVMVIITVMAAFRMSLS